MYKVKRLANVKPFMAQNTTSAMVGVMTVRFVNTATSYGNYQCSQVHQRVWAIAWHELVPYHANHINFKVIVVLIKHHLHYYHLLMTMSYCCIPRIPCTHISCCSSSAVLSLSSPLLSLVAARCSCVCLFIISHMSAFLLNKSLPP